MDTFRNIDLVYHGNLVVLGAGTFDVVLSHGSLLFKEPADGRAALRARHRHRVGDRLRSVRAASTAPAPGDTLTLDTPAGARPFDVVAVYYDYAVDRGVIVMDRGTFVKHFGDLRADRHRRLSARRRRSRARPRRDPRRARRRAPRLHLHQPRTARRGAAHLRQHVRHHLRARDHRRRRRDARRGATLLTLVIERRRELSMLRLIGAARRQVQRMVVIEAALIGAASQAIGLVVGLVLSLLLVYVINVQSFGWTIQFRVPVMFLAQVSVAVIVATALAGVYPAGGRRAAGRGAGGVATPAGCGAGRLGDWALVAAARSLSLALAPISAHGRLARGRRAGYRFAFPRDHASHPDYKLEWWYYTGNCRPPAGRRFGYQVTFFRVGVDRRRPTRRAGRCATLHDAPGGLRSVRQALSLRRAAQSRRAGAGGRRHRALSGVERRLAASLDAQGRHTLARRRRAAASISCSTKARRRRSTASTASARRARRPATRRTTTR